MDQQIENGIGRIDWSPNCKVKWRILTIGIIIINRFMESAQGNPATLDSDNTSDLSLIWVHKHHSLAALERGMTLNDMLYKQQDKSKSESEFKILEHMTQSTEHVKRLFRGPEQFAFNRYPNIIPYEHTRVHLTGPDPLQNYINASFISTRLPGELIVATQGPLSNTVEHFWRMVDQQHISVIFMLCNLQETKGAQCARYWPDDTDPDHTLDLPEYEVKFLGKNQIVGHLMERKFKLVKKSNTEEKEIIQYHWKGWGDHEAPTEQSYGIVHKLLDLAIDTIMSGGKLVVHCSAGVGRTGTFISLINLKLQIIEIQEQRQRGQQQESLISVFSTVRQLREQRWGMVYRSQQYVFLYEFLQREFA